MSALLPLLAFLAYCGTIALGLWAIVIVAEDTPEDASDEQAHGDIAAIPTELRRHH